MVRSVEETVTLAERRADLADEVRTASARVIALRQFAETMAALFAEEI